MSKIQTELLEATGEKAKARGEDTQDFLVRLLKAVAKLKDADFDALSAKAQDWYNDAADARNAKKDVPDFEEEEAKEEPAPTRRGGAKAAEKEEKSVAKVGSRVKVTNVRDKVYEGTITELDDDLMVLDSGDEIDRAKIKSCEIFHGDAGAEDGPDDEDLFVVGAEVKVVNKRGKEFQGEITEITEDELVLQTDDGAEDFQRSRIETMTLIKAAKGITKPAAKKEEEAPARRGATKKEEAADDKGTRSKNEPGVSVGQRIKELYADALKAGEEPSKESIGKALKAEKIEFKDNTLSLNFAEIDKTIAVLKAKKLIK